MGTEYVMELEEMQPVDPVALHIPDYFDVVKNPMDLSTIHSKLLSGEYSNPWEFCDDMYLMFDNAWLYNRRLSRVYKCCNVLSELFVRLFNPLMVQLGYCCGMMKRYTPLSVFCYGKSMCIIGKNDEYYCYETTVICNGSEVPDKYSYCLQCFGTLPVDGIPLPDTATEKNRTVSKDQFKPCRNNVFVMEPFINCQGCFRQFHEICVHNKKQHDAFVCDRCRALGIEPRKEVTTASQASPRRVELSRGPDGKFGVIHRRAAIGRVIRGSSAEEKGMKRGDEIIAINDISLENFNHQEIVKMLEGAIGTVKLLIRFNPRLLKKMRAE